MEHHYSLTSLMIVMGIAFFVPILLQRIRLKVVPVVVAEIIAGIIIGKSGFNLVHTGDPWLELLSLLGFIFLMFLSGLEIDFDSIFPNKKRKRKELSFNPLIVASVVFIGILFISLGLSYGLVAVGFIDEPFLMTLIISTISLGIVVPVLKENNMMESPLGQTILLIAVISDVVTMILLAIYVMMHSEDQSQMMYLLLLFVFVFIIYRFIKPFIKLTWFDNLLKGTVQLGTRGVFALILIFVAISETVGAENILGAFLAGMIVSLLAPKKEFVHQLDSFGYGFLIPIFFVMVGVNIDIHSLINDSKMLMLIPILLIVLYLSKLVPILILRKWYPWKEVMSSGMLLTSTLSLVIAAAAIGLNMGVIDEKMHGLLILVAILTCFISPIVFGKVKIKKVKIKDKISIVGANRMTLPTSIDFANDDFEVMVYGTKQSKIEPTEDYETKFPICELEAISLQELIEKGAFESDVIILGTSYDDKNIEFAKYAMNEGIEKIIVRVENPQLHEKLINEGFAVFSTTYATRTLLKAMVSNPSIMKFISRNDDLLKEVEVRATKYDGESLRRLPFLGDALILQIYRGKESIVPHGDTKLKKGDVLIVSGTKESIKKMKRELE